MSEAPLQTQTSSASILRSIVSEHGRAMVSVFYDTLLHDEEAKQFLSHSVVHSRLSVSLLDWLIDLLDEEDIRQSAELQDKQKVVGEIHARIKIPIHLVMQGATVLKSHILRVLADSALDMRAAMDAALLAGERVDTAIMLMSQAYVKDTTARARLDEAYRLFSLDQDVAIEKETQRASLMEWSQKTLFSLLRGQERGGLGRLSDSSFGLWIRHRAEFMFEQSKIFQDLISEIHRIDDVVLPQLEEPGVTGQALGILGDLQASVDRISFLIGELFQTLAAMENGRDPLTRALNRRFLPAILGREITFANERNSPLVIIMLDVDHFKAINDQHGHQIGDTVLRQVAQVIMEHVRPSDFVFRYGGEEFLLILAETSLEQAQQIAERIRSELASRTLQAGVAETLFVTASLGLAQHTGHPDQKYLIKTADNALYAAKANGRNRIEIAPVGQP